MFDALVLLVMLVGAMLTSNFKEVSIENGRSLIWSDEIDLDADSLYLKLTGKKPEELFPALKEEPAHA